MRRISAVSIAGALVVTLGILAGIAVQADENGNTDSHVVLTISSTEKGFDDDQSLTFGGSDLGGTAVIFLNEDPISVLSSGGKMLRLDHWIREKRNVVSVRGHSNRTIYLKVCRARGYAVEVVLAKVSGKLGPDTQLQAAFALDDAKKLPAIERLIGDAGKEVAELEVRKFVSLLCEKIRSRNVEGISRLSETRAEWETKVYGRLKADVDKEVQRGKDFFGDPNLTVGEPAGKLEIEVGTNVALIWRRDLESQQNVPIFELKTAGLSLQIREWKVVRRDGELTIWE